MSAADKATAQETVRLRAAPPRVARLSRPAIAVLAGLGAAGLGAALALALQPHAAKPVVIKADETDGKTPQAIVTGPRTYAEVPKLGPPLPGDLGRPILSAQARGQEVPTPPMGAPAPDPAADARRQALAAARSSGVFTASKAASATPLASAASPPQAAPQTIGLSPISQIPPTGTAPTSSNSRRAFLDERNAPPTTSAFQPAPPAGRHVLLAQTIIPAALVTAVSSNLPGPIAAQVTRNVHDSLTGRHVLIPQGSKLIGSYDNQVAFGQKRVLLAWDRVIFPDGRSLQLDRLVGADTAGRSGLSDKTDAHWGAMGKAALLSSVLGVGASLGSSEDSDIARALRQGVQDTFNQTGQQVVRKQLDVQPTLTLRAGLPLTILVTRDIIFDD
ncbi:TrbI/VirB10 family protein [Caulobacter segnis]|uniref:TrbI/VirB10 family protein n=1 Tax=Caulobacter segnis TaxID=88688 RepID=UPI00286467DF|nr:TrbI/VirB10 family protein [Caulobacter segnis]MDR6624451.1 type IV secretion system protein VirB10 [Caulobacter segnis]